MQHLKPFFTSFLGEDEAGIFLDFRPEGPVVHRGEVVSAVMSHPQWFQYLCNCGSYVKLSGVFMSPVSEINKSFNFLCLEFWEVSREIGLPDLILEGTIKKDLQEYPFCQEKAGPTLDEILKNIEQQDAT